MDLHLTGQTALVTGATAGIGLAIAERLALEGADLVLPGRDRAKLDAAAAGIAAAGGTGRVRTVLADAGSAEGAALLAREVPQVDVLVNNLGIYEARAFEAITDADWHRLFETNVVGGARLAQAYFPGMLARNAGRIVFVSSESGLVPPPDMIHYAVTKSAQLTIARALAQRTRGTAVTVNAVLPGPTRSEGIVDFLRSVASDPDAAPAELEAEFFRVHRPLSLIGRMIEPKEIAAMVAYLASPLAAATNGAALRVEGGIVPTIA
ncbi:3-oxoacyl-[acyl-carrier-protein] reductase FabG [Methylobacterium crusticola]|uniref:3-oxoacyl-[acyl-carrier-protein] reductase FabG n=1 Tax=Methylobacterium crusticola TaxID=1697972 RepID=A0ABQ4QWD8_9HYPH|nr:SDR family oxidoreductase [Methylobacterium crusticola]GJD48966.1 3-oxoacyl-[acyl-carrier-protein] reductase FabG [Methylobacterium crusticola]